MKLSCLLSLSTAYRQLYHSMQVTARRTFQVYQLSTVFGTFWLRLCHNNVNFSTSKDKLLQLNIRHYQNYLSHHCFQSLSAIQRTHLILFSSLDFHILLCLLRFHFRTWLLINRVLTLNWRPWIDCHLLDLKITILFPTKFLLHHKSNFGECIPDNVWF